MILVADPQKTTREDLEDCPLGSWEQGGCYAGPFSLRASEDQWDG